MTHYYRGCREGQEWIDLWDCAQSVDLTLAEAYGPGGPQGYAAVCTRLATDDRVEGWCTRISAQVTFLRTGERAMRDQLQTTKPPGSTDLAPDWAVAGARDTAKALYLQGGRIKGATSTASFGDEEGDSVSRRRRPRPRKPNDSSTGGGGGGGGAKAPPAAKH